MRHEKDDGITGECACFNGLQSAEKEAKEATVNKTEQSTRASSSAKRGKRTLKFCCGTSI